MIKHYFYLIIVLLTGCGPVVNVDVDSICTSNAKEKDRYILIPGNENCSNTDLNYIEYANYTEQALQDLGFTKVSSLDDANVVIILHYGISDPQFYQYTYSVPVWGQTGIESSSTYGSVNMYGNSGSYSESTTYTPSYGVVGSTTHLGTGVLFKRHLALSGFDLDKYKEANEVVEIWTTKAVSVGANGDLRKIFPYLLAASKKHIASNTGEKISYELYESDKKVKEIRDGFRK